MTISLLDIWVHLGSIDSHSILHWLCLRCDMCKLKSMTCVPYDNMSGVYFLLSSNVIQPTVLT